MGNKGKSQVLALPNGGSAGCYTPAPSLHCYPIALLQSREAHAAASPSPVQPEGQFPLGAAPPGSPGHS